MRTLDLVVLVLYLVVIATVGLRLSGRQRSTNDYFVGEAQMPWWAVCFSVVATETSVLTVISVPGGAYTTQAFGNVELAFGYIIGRVVVADRSDPALQALRDSSAPTSTWRCGSAATCRAWPRSPSSSPG